MKVGDTIKFKFGKTKKKMEGVVVKLFPKTVYMKVDFPKNEDSKGHEGHKGKIIKRKIHQVS